MASGKIPWGEYPFVQEFFTSVYQPGTSHYLAFLEDGLCHFSGELSFEQPAENVKKHHTLMENPPEDRRDRSHQVFLEIVNKVSCKFGVYQDRILNGRRDHISSCVRREILRACVREKGIARRSVCKWPGITEAGGRYLLKADEHPDTILPNK
jgi:hypothetical protein